MIACCDRRTGNILFSETKPRDALLIAEHPSIDVLCDAVKFSDACYRTQYRGGRQTGDASFSVPWFSTAKFPEDEEERVRQFAERVRAWLDNQSSVH